jgi:hypothetical protein
MRDQGRFLLVRGGQAAGRALARPAADQVQGKGVLSWRPAGSGFLQGTASLLTLGYATECSCVVVRNGTPCVSWCRLFGPKMAAFVPA